MQLCTFARDLALQAVDHAMEAAGMALSGASHNHSHSSLLAHIRPAVSCRSVGAAQFC